MSIPVRNIWWLMLYASDLGKSTDAAQLAAEDLPEDIPDLVAEILARAVEQRQRRQLSTAFRQRGAVLSRVRGRIDHLSTARRQLLAQGRIACRFEELTVDSPRNRFVRTALESVARLVRKPELAHRCRGLAHGLHRQGVVGEAPSRRQISGERFGLHDQADQAMLAAARLAIDLALPTEEAGPHALLDPQRCVHWLRRLYEKAIGGFYRLHLNASEWVVSTGRPLSWPLQEATSGIAQVFPSMRTDIVIDRRDRPQRRSQEGQDNPATPWADSAAGLLLHPAIDTEVDEAVNIQGHRLRFATVDLTGSHADLRARLLQLASQE